jgi:hypothetical protein
MAEQAEIDAIENAKGSLIRIQKFDVSALPR